MTDGSAQSNPSRDNRSRSSARFNPNEFADTPFAPNDFEQNDFVQDQFPRATGAHKKRRIELVAAVLLLLFVMISTWVQLTFFGVDSWMFIAFLNINCLLMVVILFLVARNMIKLFMERKQNVFGSRIRTRLVFFFILLSLVPTVLMFLASNRVVGTSVDYWFTHQTETVLAETLDVGQNFYAVAAERLNTRSKALMQELEKLPDGDIDHFLQTRQEEYGLTMLGITDAAGKELYWHATPAFTAGWKEARKQIDWQNQETFHSVLWGNDQADYVMGVLAIAGGEGYLITAESIGQGLLNKLERISHGFEEYAQLKQLKKPLKVSFQLILGVLGLVTVFGSIWFAFRLSRQFTAPILALARGTIRIARGDLNFRLEDKGVDEISQLVTSFNSMAEDLRIGQEKLTRANLMLTERSHYIETVLDNITTGVITLNADGNILTINKAACKIFKTRADRLTNRNPANFLPPVYSRVYTSMLETLRRHPERRWTWQEEFRVGDRSWKLMLYAVALTGDGPNRSDPSGAGQEDRPAGRSDIGRTGTEQAETGHTDGMGQGGTGPAGNGKIRAFVIVVDDITELEKMQRMAAWREVARRIAHEIKNPLTPIKLSAQRLDRKFGARVGDPVFGQCTDLIVKQVERLQSMVEEFSAFAKLPEVRLVPGNLVPLLEEIIALFRNSHSHVRWELETPREVPPMEMDTAALQRAFLNIYTNAAEAMNDMPPEAERRVRTSVLYNAKLENLRVVIQDTGPGMRPEERERMFEPYYTRKKGGTGLGLVIVKSIVADHHGSVRATASARGGLAILIDFPVLRKQ